MTSPLTVVIPASPVPSHPSTEILDQTLDSVRVWHPAAEILLTFDGVRAEQEDRYDAYEEFIRRALWRCDKVYGGVVPFIFEEHRHQSGMLKAVIDEIRTPLLMYVEADCPLVTDEPIEWDAICEFITEGESNLVRLHHEGRIPDEHRHMIHGVHGWLDDRIDFVLTSQWSQRPHVASVAYYRRIITDHFSEQSRCFIEDKMHGVVDNAYRRDGMAGWLQHRLHIYHPDTGNIKRSYTTDGRAGEPKYDDTQVW
ncbi:hypothetical protein [Mycobacterium kansasii]|uniref:hypothetical protein n=1 Tax=Mycobacterium kansasii TaxID=1768 RepID=UPI001CA56A91|nr:hypothetical protein [Mycobacterium kansasii]